MEYSKNKQKINQILVPKNKFFSNNSPEKKITIFEKPDERPETNFFFGECKNAPKIVYLKLPVEQYNKGSPEKEIPTSEPKDIKKTKLNPQEQEKYFRENFLKAKNVFERLTNKNKDKEVVKEDVQKPKITKNILKEEINRLDQEIKQEQLDKTKNLLAMQNVLVSKIINKEKNPAVNNYILTEPNQNINFQNEKPSSKNEPCFHKSEKGSNPSFLSTTKNHEQTNKIRTVDTPIILSARHKKVPSNSNSTTSLKPSQESLMSSYLMRTNKIFINENNKCMIVDPANVIENLRNSMTKNSRGTTPQNSLVQSRSNINLKGSSVLQTQGSLALFNKKQMEGVEKILNEDGANANCEEKLNILSCTDVIDRNEKWLREKMRKGEKLKKEKESEEVKECSFNPTFFTKGYRSSSNSRISTLVKNSETSVFSTHRSIISNIKGINQSDLDEKFEKLKIRGNNFNSKWYLHGSYKKEFERKKEFSNKKK